MALTGIFKGEQQNLRSGVIDQDKFQDLVNEAFAGIRKHYIQGAVQYLVENHPNIICQIQESEIEVEKYWVEQVGRETGISDFRGLLIKWYQLWLLGIRTFEEHKTIENSGGKERPPENGGEQMKLDYD